MNIEFTHNYLMVTPRLTQIIRYGGLFERMLGRFNEIEDEHFERNQKTPSDVLERAIKSILLIINIVRAGLRIGDGTGPSSDVKEILALSPFPTPLTALYHGLLVRLSGGVSPLLAHDAEGIGHEPSKLLRQIIRGATAAAVKALTRPGQKKPAAIKRVTEALNRAGFPNPGRNGKPYTEETITDWCNFRTQKRGKFGAHYDDWNGRFLSMRESGKDGQIATDDEIDSAILRLLVSLPAAFSFSIDHTGER